jgi:putative endopeptidase
MSEKTKEYALKKLKTMNIKIGYPKIIKNYDNLKLSFNNSYLTNNILCIRYNNKINFKKLYKPIDKNEWFMNAFEVNAYYSPLYNEIVFPAGILQNPFFDVNNSIYENFGGIGTIIGHEIIHGFDDKGRLFDYKGNLKPWWTDEDNEKYKTKVKILQDQFSNYKINGQSVNGELTLGENIADLGGVTFALLALKDYLKDNNMTENKDDYKLFFKKYAENWATKIRDELMKIKLLNDPHSPSIFRVNGILRNIDKFYETYDIKENDLLYLEKNKRAIIF